MERDPGGGSDYGRDVARDFGDEPVPAIRDQPPDYLTPIDPSAPVSGHVPPPTSGPPIAESPEHDWELAQTLLYPILRPVGTQGLDLDAADRRALGEQTGKAHTQPLVAEGPCGLTVVFALHAGGFDVLVNGDHLLDWGVEPQDVERVALANLATWSRGASWTDEASGERRLLSSDTGEGWDASRILLPEVRDHLVAELGPSGRVLVGLPDRHLLVAGTLRPGDEEFARLFADFIVEQSGGADEPVDRRVFELVHGRLVEFAPVGAS